VKLLPVPVPAGTGTGIPAQPYDSVDTSLASLLYSCKTDAVLSEVHDQ